MSGESRSRPALFRALGRSEPPDVIVTDGDEYRLAHIYKHDSWAATARYEGRTGAIVCKFNRVQPILGIPMRWLGHRLARRESAFLLRLQGLEGIPTLCGPICVLGKSQQHAVAHGYIPGEPLNGRQRLADGFFPGLKKILEAIHTRGIAYVDLHKRENVLVGTDGKPHLIDFQVCFGTWHQRWMRVGWAKSCLAALQDADRYHLAKHIANFRPDQARQLGANVDGLRPWWIKGHRVIGVPLRQLRRGLLTLLGVRKKGGRAESELFPEEAVRQGWRRAA